MKFTKKEIFVFIIIIILCFVAVGLYFYHFNNNLAASSQEWANFGNYISGVLVPLLTIINIALFYKLTIAVSDADDKRRRKELDYQKKLILAQLRQKELETFSSIMNNALIFKAELLPINMTIPLSQALVYLDNFCNGKQELFPLIKANEAKFVTLHGQLKDFSNIFQENITKGTFTPIDTGKVTKSLQLKHEIMSILQKFIIDDMSKTE